MGQDHVHIMMFMFINNVIMMSKGKCAYDDKDCCTAPCTSLKPLAYICELDLHNYLEECCIAI